MTLNNRHLLLGPLLAITAACRTTSTPPKPKPKPAEVKPASPMEQLTKRYPELSACEKAAKTCEVSRKQQDDILVLVISRSKQDSRVGLFKKGRLIATTDVPSEQDISEITIGDWNENGRTNVVLELTKTTESESMSPTTMSCSLLEVKGKELEEQLDFACGMQCPDPPCAIPETSSYEFKAKKLIVSTLEALEAGGDEDARKPSITTYHWKNGEWAESD